MYLWCTFYSQIVYLWGTFHSQIHCLWIPFSFYSYSKLYWGCLSWQFCRLGCIQMHFLEAYLSWTARQLEVTALWSTSLYGHDSLRNIIIHRVWLGSRIGAWNSWNVCFFCSYLGLYLTYLLYHGTWWPLAAFPFAVLSHFWRIGRSVCLSKKYQNCQKG